MSEQITEPMPLLSDPTPLPAAALEPSIDAALVDDAVAFINRAALVSGLQLASTVSSYVVDTFFAGDFAAVSSKDPHKTASFAALCQRDDLNMGEATLLRLVRIGHQARHLPADLAENLTLSHHRVLLAVPDGQHKQHLARMAVQHGWTVEQLQALILGEKPALPHPLGRPPKPVPLKWLGAVQKAVGQASDAQWTAEVERLAPAHRAQLRAELLALQGQIQARLAAVP